MDPRISSVAAGAAAISGQINAEVSALRPQLKRHAFLRCPQSSTSDAYTHDRCQTESPSTYINRAHNLTDADEHSGKRAAPTEARIYPNLVTSGLVCSLSIPRKISSHARICPRASPGYAPLNRRRARAKHAAGREESASRATRAYGRRSRSLHSRMHLLPQLYATWALPDKSQLLDIPRTVVDHRPLAGVWHSACSQSTSTQHREKPQPGSDGNSGTVGPRTLRRTTCNHVEIGRSERGKASKH